MFPESKVTKIYCMADNFCNEFALQEEIYEDSRQKMEKEILFSLTIFIKKVLV